MKICKNLKEKYYSEEIHLFEWILAAVVGLFVFTTSTYYDLPSLTIWSTNIWDVTLDSNIYNLYEYTAQNIYGAPHRYLGSEIMSVLPWSIWNLPIWALQRFAGILILENPFCLAWSKLFLVFLTVIMLIYTHKIAMLLTRDEVRSKIATFLTGSSLFLYFAVCYAGQNDILMIVPSLIGIYYLLKGKNVAFYAFSALAISIKPFYAIAFITVVLLTEKNFIRIFAKALIGASGFLLEKLIFSNAPMYQESMSKGPTSRIMNVMFPTNIKTSFGPISFFAVAFFLICFYAYTRKFDLKKDEKSRLLYMRYVIYTVALTYFSYIMFSAFSYYRIILLLPFLYLVIIQNKKVYMYNMLLDLAMNVGLIMHMILRGSQVFKLKTVNDSIFQFFLGYSVDYDKAAYPSIKHFLSERLSVILDMHGLFSAVALIAAILILILNHPVQKVSLPANAEKCPRVLYWIRTVIIVPFLLFTLYMFVKTSCRIY